MHEPRFIARCHNSCSMTGQMTSEFKSSARRKAILHFGMPKCGSSALQKELSFLIQQEPLSRHLLYPLPINHSGVLTRAFCGERYNAMYHGNVALGISPLEARREGEKYAKMLKALLISNPNKTLVLSSEDILFWDPIDIKTLVDFFLEMLLPIEVIIYVRRPRPWITSVFAERVRHCIAGTPLFEQNINSLSIFTKIKRIATEALGNHCRLKLLRYEDVFSARSIAEHFLLSCGLDTELLASAFLQASGSDRYELGTAVNSSLTLLSLKVAWTYLSLFPRSSKKRTNWDSHFRAINHFQSIEDTRSYRFSPSLPKFEDLLGLADQFYDECFGSSSAPSISDDVTLSKSAIISSRGDIESFTPHEAGLINSFLEGQGRFPPIAYGATFAAELSALVHQIYLGSPEKSRPPAPQ